MADSTTARNAKAAAWAALANTGVLRIYDGTQPADPQTAITSQVLLGAIVLANPAFGSPSTGTVTANAASPVTTSAAGVATWYRLFESDGTTVIRDGDVSLPAGAAECKLVNTNIQPSQPLTLSSFTYSQP